MAAPTIFSPYTKLLPKYVYIQKRGASFKYYQKQKKCSKEVNFRVCFPKYLFKKGLLLEMFPKISPPPLSSNIQEPRSIRVKEEGWPESVKTFEELRCNSVHYLSQDHKIRCQLSIVLQLGGTDFNFKTC